MTWDWKKWHIAHEAAICRNSPLNFTAGSKNLTARKQTKINNVTFLRKYEGKHFVCGHNILTEGVFVTQLSGDVAISV